MYKNSKEYTKNNTQKLQTNLYKIFSILNSRETTKQPKTNQMKENVCLILSCETDFRK